MYNNIKEFMSLIRCITAIQLLTWGYTKLGILLLSKKDAEDLEVIIAKILSER